MTTKAPKKLTDAQVRTRTIPDSMTGVQLNASLTAFDALEAMGAKVQHAGYTDFWIGHSTRQVYGPDPFTWGEVLAVHKVGPYAIVEAKRGQYSNESDADFATANRIGFHIFIDGWIQPNGWKGTRDVGHSYSSLDAALIGCVVKRREQVNHGHNAALNERLTGYIMRMVGEDDEDA
jgi:hypothetical protein